MASHPVKVTTANWKKLKSLQRRLTRPPGQPPTMDAVIGWLFERDTTLFPPKEKRT